MVTALIVSFTGVLIAGLAGVLGVWMERDPKSSATWAVIFSTLILFATGVELIHTGYQTFVDARTDIQLAKLLGRLSDLSENNPELDQFVGAELAVQARANPNVVTRLEKSVAAKGGDPNAVRQRAAAGRRKAAGLSAEPPPPRPKAGAAGAAKGPGKAGKGPGKADGGKAGKAKSGKADGGKAGAAAAAAAKDPDAAKGKAEGAVDDAKAKVDDAKAKVDDAKAKAEETKEAVNNAADKAKDVAKDPAKAGKGAVDDLLGGGKGGKGKGGKSGKGPNIPGF